MSGRAQISAAGTSSLQSTPAASVALLSAEGERRGQRASWRHQSAHRALALLRVPRAIPLAWAVQGITLRARSGQG